ncbi:GFA family protein [Aquirhabdus parva]|uniref:Aldehyde-activating protein n=1 Tax=Aquirhabdus parva TaxID=2283318 RepID=A0A345P4F2_9GAMM|nr:aldehyde-activating protein [Aquirhabdus parva]AXI02161.1 aldehyde-activating protein [Aquirhabdus parva]
MDTTAYVYAGGCHCSNIKLAVELTKALNAYKPRACDCDFCKTHGASYLSDPQGKLVITTKDKDALSRYRQGDAIADFLICKICGVVAGVSFQSEAGLYATIEAGLYATINVKALSDRADCLPETSVSPKLLSTEDKIERWKKAWFSDVKFE